MSSPAKINPPDAEVHNAPDMDPDATAAALEPTRHPFVAWAIAVNGGAIMYLEGGSTA